MGIVPAALFNFLTLLGWNPGGDRELIARDGHVPSLDEVSAICGVSLAEMRALFPGVAEEVLARLAGAQELERTDV